MADGSTSIGAYLPLIVASGGVEFAFGVIGSGLGWLHASLRMGQSDLAPLAGLAALTASRSTGHGSASTAAERSEWFERMAHTTH